MASWRNGSGRGATEEMMDRENQMTTERLSSKVGMLNQIALDINKEADESNRYLDGLGTDFDSSQGLLSGSVNRLSHMMAAGKNNRRLTCYIIAGLLAAFLLLYFILTRWRS